MSCCWLRHFLLTILFLLFVCLIDEFCQAGGGGALSSPTTVNKGHKKQQPSVDSLSSTSSKKLRHEKGTLKQKNRNAKSETFVDTVNNEASGYWQASKYEWIAKLRETQTKLFAGVIEKLFISNKKKNEGKKNDKKGTGRKAEEEKPVESEGESAAAKTATTKKGKWACTETDEFDVRTKEEWADCHSVFKRIEAQGLCGSCWAIAATASFSDRYCIKNIHNAKERGKHFSAMDVLTCMKSETKGKGGCAGEQPESALDFIAEHGVVTSECKPLYKALSSGTSLIPLHLPKCKQDSVKGSKLDYHGDKHRGGKARTLRGKFDDAIKKQIENQGSVAGSIDTYMDFLFYKKGVYTRSKAPINFKVGYHAIRIIGWGTQTCTKPNEEPERHAYWIVANSWGENWGEHGFFKIRRGVDECHIETHGVAFSPADTTPTQMIHHTGVVASGSGGADPKDKRDKSPSASLRSSHKDSIRKVGE